MRIAVYHNLPSGGAKRSLYEFVKRLVDRHVIDVYSLATADHDFCDLRPLAHAHHVYPFAPLPLYDSPLGRLNQWQRWRDVQRLDRLARRIAAEIDRRRYDVVYVQPCRWTQAPLVLRYLLTPTVYFLHEPPRALYDAPLGKGNHGWRGRLDQIDPLLSVYVDAARRVDRQATRAAGLVLVNSEFIRQVASRIYGISPTVAHMGVDEAVFTPAPRETEGDYVLSVGAIQPSKGFDFLIRSLSMAPMQLRPRLVLVGNAEVGGERERLLALARESDVRLTIEVGVDQATLVQRYQEARLVVYAPVNEPFGLVALEAMACGKPVIGVAEGGVRESVIDGVTGVLTPRDPRLFGDAVAHLLANAPLQAQYGRQAREHVVANWTWSASVARIEAFLRATVQREAA